jgi:type VI secretion system protein ImpK
VISLLFNYPLSTIHLNKDMQTSAAQTENAAPPRQNARGTNDLVQLAAPVLELVLKLKTGAITPSNDVRPVVADLIAQLEAGAVQVRCPPRQVQDVKFALVAFLDETVLSPQNNFPYREEWERKPLQLEYFKEHLAGVKFFERLDRMLADIEAEADVVEVYYLCLLLGFKGKYNIYLLEGELKGVVENVAEKLRQIDRLRPVALSAHWQATDQPEVPAEEPFLPRWFKFAAPAALGLVVVTYVVLYLLLQNELNIVR